MGEHLLGQMHFIMHSQPIKLERGEQQ